MQNYYSAAHEAWWRFNLFWISVTTCKTEQPPQGMQLQENKDENHRGKLYRKDTREKGFY